MIREMEARDIAAGCRLMRDLGYTITPEQMRERLEFVQQSPIDWLYVSEINGDVCGLLGFRLRERIEQPGTYGEISVLVTDAQVRRQGVGRALVDFAEQLAHDKGCMGTWLVSGFGRADEAHRFYQSLGYEITGYRFVKPFTSK